MITNEFSKLIRSKILYISVFIGILSCLLGLISYYDTAFWSYDAGLPEEISAYNAWLDCLSVGSSVYRLILPLIIVPFLDSYYLERRSGYQNYLLTRASRKQYFFSKWFVGILSAAMIVLVVLAVTFAICAALFPLNPPLPEMSHVDRNFGFAFYLKKPMSYIVLLILSNMYFAVIYYTVGFSLSNLIRNRYLLLLSPFIIYIVQLLVWQLFRLPYASPLIFIAFYEVNNLTPVGMVIAGLVYLVIAGGVLTWCYRKDINELS